MIIYYSGQGATWANPEIMLQDECNLMLTYMDSFKREAPEKRFKAVLKGRRRKLRKQEENDAGAVTEKG